MKELAFVVWDLSPNDAKLLSNIKKYTEGLFGDEEVNITIDDLKSLGETTYQVPCIIFGGMADNCAQYKEAWVVANLEMMQPEHDDYVAHKKRTMETLTEAVGRILRAKEPEPISTHVETPEGITVGPDGCQINITEAEADHLKKIKEILGGGKMVITKGDIRIEVE